MAKPALDIDIFGTRYDIFRQSRVTVDGEAADGYCENPRLYTPGRNKKLIVRRALRGRALCETLCHELLHAFDFDKKEEYVEHAGQVLAEVLTHPEFEDLIYYHA